MNQSQAGATGRDFDAARGAPQPLSSLPEFTHGGTPADRIGRVLADLIAELSPLHAGWRVHGGVALGTVGVDHDGRAHLLTGPASPTANAESAARAPGYAAFEQYTDDPQNPCGPWTDVYALSALGYALATGEPPPPALQRCVRDDYVPLVQRMQDPAAAGFAQAIDAGLALDHRVRPGTLDQLLQRLGARATPVAPVAPLPAGAAASAASPGTPPPMTAPVAPTAPTPVAPVPSPFASAPEPAPAVPTPIAAPVPAPAPLPMAPAAPPLADRIPPAPVQSASSPAAVAPEPAPRAMPDPFPEPIPEQFPEPIPEPIPEPAPVPVPPVAAESPGHRAQADEDRGAADAAPPKPAQQATKPPSRVSWVMVLVVLVVIGCAVFFWMRMQGSDAPLTAGNGPSSAPTPANPPRSLTDTPPPPEPPQPRVSQPSSGAAPQAGAPGTASPSAGNPPPTGGAAADPYAGNGSSLPQGNGQVPPPSSTATPGATGGVPPMTAQPGTPGNGASSGVTPGAAQPPTPGASVADGALSSPNATTAQPGAVGGVPGTVQPSTGTATGSATDPSGAATATTDALAAAAAETPPKPTTGTVNLNISPWGEVLVDGRSRGVSPPLRSLTLPAGKHTITVRNPAASDYQVSIDLSEGRSASVSHKFE
ncbi:membrane protein [Bordetella ansorpii]|uniref:Membrane protein n=1 Tax=Bordetella ansorpii TaxID=288768 RepID=A0A157NXZ2_9BORD|nr:hypothetical protein [Bordetella ansorpii]SAI26187.1 membrane protein [Bordetella ansorpii]